MPGFAYRTWGDSWGSSWGDSWGVGVTPAVVRGGGAGGPVGGWRRVRWAEEREQREREEAERLAALQQQEAPQPAEEPAPQPVGKSRRARKRAQLRLVRQELEFINAINLAEINLEQVEAIAAQIADERLRVEVKKRLMIIMMAIEA